MTKTILILGSSSGGLHAAAHARRYDEDARIILVDEDKRIFANSPQALYCSRFGIEIREARATQIDPDANCLHLKSGRKVERLPYDALIYLGRVETCELAIDGVDPSSILTLRDVKAMQAAVHKQKHAVIIGCGLRGIESALMLSRAGASVTLIEKRRRMLPEFSLPFSHAIRSLLFVNNVTVLLNDSIVLGTPCDDRRYVLQTSSGKGIEADLLVNAASLCPENALLNDAGAALDIDGFVRVDDHLATTLPNIFACGSAIKVPFVLTHERKWLLSPGACLATALIAGKNAAMPERESLSPFCNAMVIPIASMSFGRTGLTDEEARLFLGDDNMVVFTVYDEHAPMQTSPSYCVRLVFDAKRQVIVGAEYYGKGDVAGRISLLSHAIAEGFTPKALLDVDMVFGYENDSLMLDPLKEAALRAQFHFAHVAPLISAETFALWLKSHRDFRLVDVSDAPAFSGRTVKPLMHVPFASLRARADEFRSKDTPIVLYANSSEQSQRAQQSLMHAGLTNVFSLDGGITTFALLCATEDA